MAIQLLIANFLYSPPGLLQIADAEAQLPEWLLADYCSLYEQKAASNFIKVSSQFSLLPSCPSLILVFSLPLFRSWLAIVYS